MKKTITILCLLALLLSSCSQAETIDTSEPQSDTQQVEAETTLTSQIQSLYDTDINYDGYEYRIAGIQPGGHFYHKINAEANEIWYAEQTGDSYSDAIYTRNMLTEGLCNITIVPNWCDSRDAVATLTEMSVKTDDDFADMTLTSLYLQITQATHGTLHNLHTIDTITLDASWYDPDIIQNYSYKGNKLYCITGAYNVFDDYAVPVIFYGKQILSENGLTDPAEYVREGTWTLDKMMSMAETVTNDANGDGKMDEKDTWGFLDNTDFYPHLLEGAGQPRTTVGSDGIPVLNVNSAAYLDMGEKVYNLVVESSARYIGENSVCRDIVKEDRGLFYYELLGAINEFREMESDFSLLPMPKGDEALENYTSAINPTWCTAVSIPVTVSDVDRAGIVFNVLSAFSVNTVDATLNELLLGSKLVRDKDTLEMLDYVLDSKVYDWANGFDWASSIKGALYSQSNANAFQLASSMQSAAPAAEKALAEFLDKLDVLP